VTWRISLGNVKTDGEDNIKGDLNKSNKSVWAVTFDSEEESVPLFCLHGMNMQDPPPPKKKTY
jgi:hypothetical protein